MKGTGILSLTHERVELIPLLLDCIQRQNSPILLERYRGSREAAGPCLSNPLPPNDPTADPAAGRRNDDAMTDSRIGRCAARTCGETCKARAGHGKGGGATEKRLLS